MNTPAAVQLLKTALRRTVAPFHTRVSQRPMASATSGGCAQAPAALSGRRDAYEGLIIDEGTLPATREAFADALQERLPAWRDEGYRGIWLKLPKDKAHHVGVAVDAGFEFHHAEKGYLMLTQWLPDTEDKLPENASHQVGVGAFVWDPRTRRLLVVQERSGPLKGKGVWKMPTGLVRAGEDITEAAAREVLEETGVRARFRAVLAMRQAHGVSFGKSDLFFVVALEPEEGPHVLAPQEDEIEAVQWMPLAEYCALEGRPLLRKIMERCAAYADGRYAGLTGTKLSAGFSGRDDLLLFGDSADAGSGGGGAGGAADGAENADAWIGIS